MNMTTRQIGIVTTIVFIAGIAMAEKHCLSVPGIEVCSTEHNFCNTTAPSCGKTTYDPCKGECVGSESTLLWCEDKTVLGTKLVYPGTCKGNGECQYGIPTQTMENWKTIIDSGIYPTVSC
jgi:hypothetical protein